MLNLPNSLTLIRIVTVPVFLILLSSNLYLEALAVLVLGGLTDALDGAVARFTGQQTPLGAYLDPAADKLLVMTSFVMLGLVGGLPMWLVVLVLSRDIIILIGYGVIYFLVAERLRIQPTVIGKINTLLQILSVAIALFFLYDASLLPSLLLDLLIFITAATTAVSGFQYIYRGLVWLQNRAQSLPRLS
jgi:cardiolipin synthase (CMP-forming)